MTEKRAVIRTNCCQSMACVVRLTAVRRMEVLLLQEERTLRYLRGKGEWCLAGMMVAVVYRAVVYRLLFFS